MSISAIPVADCAVKVYFSAVNALLGHSPSPSGEALVAQTLDAFRRAAGCELCIKIFDRQKAEGSLLGKVARRYGLHTSAFCTEVKRTRNALCIECDLHKIPALCAEAHLPFEHTCHAGGTEMIIPVIMEGRLIAIVYLGQYRVGDGQPASLPLLELDTRRYLLGLSQLIAVYLRQQLRSPRFASESSHGYRREAIDTFLRKNLRKGSTLSELAQYLGISETRAAHAVKEATGASFTTLRNAIRLERACSLLHTTYYKLTFIATECGFSSSQYFHRFFKQQMGMTPDAFRRLHRPDA